MTNSALGIRTSTTVGINTENTVERKNVVGVEMKKLVVGLHLVHVSRSIRRTELREGTTGRPISVPRIMAVAEPVQAPVPEAQPAPAEPKVELAFYRKYTEALLRRYLRLSMEVGRVPSLMGRDLFRGNVSHYNVSGYEDAVIFCIDVERCLAKLRVDEQRVIRRIAIQGYSPHQAGPFFGIEPRRCYERYGRALDRLTGIFLNGQILQPLNCCQDVETE